MSEVFFTADLHFDHVNICKYTGRPFCYVQEMNEAIIANWNSVVGPQDAVWVLGDVALGQIAQSLPLVGRLNGTKYLIAGNHDKCWVGGRTLGWTYRYEEFFEKVFQGSLELNIGGHDVLACHFPYRGDSGELERYLQWRPPDEGKVLIHGHCHGKYLQSGKMIDVGIDATGGFPLSQAELCSMIEKAPQDLPALSWRKHDS